ncbi:hypothetical protein ABZV60_34665 [Streptomyces sp. NPDC004787]|uniref:hypothetical protein n=1 Tax=Streptomyces sp. NPDC004787 TaxID=3154291 RepID=UPI0033A5383C
MKFRSILVAAAAPVLLASTAGLAAAVEPDGSAPGQDSSCYTYTRSDGHGYTTCAYTYTLNGFASSSVSETDALSKAAAKNKESSDKFRNQPGSNCNSRLTKSSFDSWYFPNEPAPAGYYDWHPGDNAYGGTQVEWWSVNCTKVF